MFEKTSIKDVIIITPNLFKDNRGYFFESYNNHKINKVLNFSPIQDNESKSKFGVLRGIHFQNQPYEQAKLVRVIKGEIQDIAVDLRPDSITYKQYVSVILNENSKKQIFIPKGFGHAFLTLSKEAIVSYKVDNYYNKELDSGIKYNDPSINIKWELDSNKIIQSDKDKNLPSLM
tara:strand:- start:356 stop:880 length:525 start_codon:yes stop_codon:yes gene_type:complete